MPRDLESEDGDEISPGWSTSSSSEASTEGGLNTEYTIDEILIPGYLDLLDLPALARLQHSLSGPVGSGHHLGVVSTVGTLLLGEGGSFVVRRVHYSSFVHAIDTWDEPFDKAKRFVVVKQPLIEKHTSTNNTGNGWTRKSDKLRAVTMELKVLSHGPIRKHPNIVKLHHFVWDTQGSLVSALAPSPILEYADLGTLDDYQDAHRLLTGEGPRIYLHADAKMDICADVAQGLAFLHRCGVIHGDVKSGNVLLFRDEIHDPCRATQIRAKISDFGSALMGVFDDGPKQERRGKTRYWAAPDPDGPMDALSLRRTDIYSYGLMVWQVMSNGHTPSTLLSLDPDRTSVSLAPTPPKCARDDFLKLNLLKHKPDDILLKLAIDSLQNRSKSDVNFEMTSNVLKLTLRRNSPDRAENFEQILEVLGGRPDVPARHLAVEPEPLSMGSISYSWPTFPRDIYACRTTPEAFRRLICEQLAAKANSKHVDSTPTQRAEASLALGICCLQGFYPGPSDVGSNNGETHSRPQRAAESIFNAAHLGHPLAQSMAARLPQETDSKLPDGQLLTQSHVEHWLQNAMYHGSLSARVELQTKFPEIFEQTARAIHQSRLVMGAFLQKERNEETTPASEFYHGLVPDTHFMTKKIIQRPGVRLLHQAAFLGRLDICQHLIRESRQTVDLRTQQEETPLQFASRGAQLHIINFLLRSGADIRAKTKDGLSVLHLALFSLEPVPILALLLSRGADPSIQAPSSAKSWLPDCYDCFVGVEASPLHMAVRLGSEDIVKTLLEGGADPNLKDENGITPLLSAIMIRSRAMLELLLPYAVKGVDNLPNPWALYPALVGFFTMPMTKQLFWNSYGNDDGDSTAFITYAADRLRAAGIGIDDRALFSWALTADDAVVVVHLIRKLVNGSGPTHEPKLMKPFRERSFHEEFSGIRPTDIDLRPDLHYIFTLAIQSRSLPVLAALSEHIKKPIPGQWSDGIPVFCALASRALDSDENVEEIVAALVSAGADTKAVERWGKGPLTIAAYSNNYQLAEVLLRYDCSDQDIEKCLQICTAKGDTETGKNIMESIFKHKPQILVRPLPVAPQDGSVLFDSSEANWIRSFCTTSEFSLAGNTILHLAKPRKDQEDLDDDYKQPVDELMLKKAIKTALSQHHRGSVAVEERLNERVWPVLPPPLHEAAARGNIGIAKILLENGASVNAFASIGRPFAAPPENIQLDDVDITNIFPVVGQNSSSEEGGAAVVEWKEEKDVASLLSPDQKFEASLTCGKTALDFALARDWTSSLRRWPQQHIPLLEELRNVGGAHREEDAFYQRTRNMVAFLREVGGKTHGEIFGLPDFMAPVPSTSLERRNGDSAIPTRQPRQQTATSTTRKAEERWAQSNNFNTATASERISRLWGYAADLPSLPVVQNLYPHLSERTDPTGSLPRLSTLYDMSTELFKEVINEHLSEENEESLEVLLSELHAQRSRFAEWALQNGVRTGELDGIQDMPGSTLPGLLAASVFVCLFEIGQVLGYMLDLANGQRDRKTIDYPNRFKELLGDLKKVVDILEKEDNQALKEMSDNAVKELEQELGIKITDLDPAGNLR